MKEKKGKSKKDKEKKDKAEKCSYKFSTKVTKVFTGGYKHLHTEFAK